MRGHAASMEWTHNRIDAVLGGPKPVLASGDALAIGHIIRKFASDVAASNRSAYAFAGPRKPHTLKAWLAHDFAQAYSWEDLAACLQSRGYALVDCDAGLTLCTHDGEPLCDLSELGQPYTKLLRRFGEPFPKSAIPRVSPKDSDPIMPHHAKEH